MVVAELDIAEVMKINLGCRVSKDPEVLAWKRKYVEDLVNPNDALNKLEELAGQKVSRNDSKWQAVYETCQIHIIQSERAGEDMLDYKQRFYTIASGRKIEIRCADFPDEYRPVKVKRYYNESGEWRK